MIGGLRGLPRHIDDAERDFGTGIYDRMLNEPYIAAAVALLKVAVLSEPLGIEPAIPMPDAPLDGSDITQSPEWNEYVRALEIATVMRANIDQVGRGTTNFRMVLFDMLEAVTHGNRVAEITEKKVTRGPFAGRQFFDSIRVIPRDYYRIIVDVFNNVLGVMSYQPGKVPPFVTGLVSPSVTEFATFTNIDKVFLLSHRPKNGDPTGVSCLRPAYAPWYEKQKLRPAELKRLGQFGGESIVFTAPDNFDEVMRSVLGTGNDAVTLDDALTQVFGQAAQNYASGTSMVIPFGAKAEVLGAISGSDLFESKEGRVNREMVLAVLSSARVIMESQRNSQADASSASDLFDLLQSFTADWLSEALQEQIFRPSVRRNYGDDVAEELTPIITLGDANRADLAGNAMGLARLSESGMITSAMLPHVWREVLGIRYIPGEPVQSTIIRAEAAQNGNLDDSETPRLPNQ